MNSLVGPHPVSSAGLLWVEEGALAELFSPLPYFILGDSAMVTVFEYCI